MAGNLRSIVAPDAQTRYWPSGDNTSDLPPKSLSEQSLVRALTPTGALSLGNYATILKTLVASNLLIKNDKSVVRDAVRGEPVSVRLHRLFREFSDARRLARVFSAISHCVKDGICLFERSAAPNFNRATTGP